MYIFNALGIYWRGTARGDGGGGGRGDKMHKNLKTETKEAYIANNY